MAKQENGNGRRAAKLWTCKAGHILGMIQWNGASVPQLLLFRNGVDHGADMPEEVDVLGPVIGWMPVRCDLCGEICLWDIQAKTFAWLSERLGQRRLDEFLIKIGKMSAEDFQIKYSNGDIK